ncbi:hypothetical protein P154DRAFT_518179 [Amniculicola lignicola CBS 123094]|uniref:Uncharacterized protein n=1 Tax=Amniculicola lignicola CBS 123094 TaxID=1392246 RepID=A0A6A5WXT7_9PLEO|nr:hypothetical protein P154DRAFT_518179 [Amniculicola lignicola CBS 123094]
MAVDNSLTTLLTTLTASIESATEALPADGTLPPKEGISLLNVKNDLLLSYVQNLVFLILLKLRSRAQSNSGDADSKATTIDEEVTMKLVELRVYLEKGVRPLENRLKYQIDQIVRAADDASRKSAQAPEKPKAGRSLRKSNAEDSDVSEDGSDASAQSDDEADAVSYGPRKAQFQRPKTAIDRGNTKSSKDGIYRPPRITPMVMPTTQGREERSRKPGRSATMDEFVRDEMNAAPVAEPSIGSTIVAGGRRTKSERERRDEQERREYEESNFVRLPAESKKDRAKKGGRGCEGGLGGEDWRGLGAGLDRIEQLTQKKRGTGGSLGSLERSRKRPIGDGPRDSGVQAGDAFEKRRKIVSRYR